MDYLCLVLLSAQLVAISLGLAGIKDELKRIADRMEQEREG